MKHLKLFATLSIISLLAVWSMATVEVQTTTPLVNPDGTEEIVGTFRLVFSNSEFGDPNELVNTTWYTLVRIHMSANAKLKKIGKYGLGPDGHAVLTDGPIPIAWERDSGNPGFVPNSWDAITIIDFTAGYIDLLFNQNMYTNDRWGLNATDRVRMTIGTPICETPTETNFNFMSFEFLPASWQVTCPDGSTNQRKQVDTRLCIDFSGPDDFKPEGEQFWRVGITAYNQGATPLPLGVTGPTLNTNFQPANPAMAMKGVPGNVCELVYDWPCKNDPCVLDSFTAGCNEPPEVHVCPTPPPPDQTTQPGPCGPAWNHGIYSIQFGSGHWFNLRTDCPDGVVGYAPGGVVTITLQNPVPSCTGMNPLFTGSPVAILFDPLEPINGYYTIGGIVSPNDEVITFTLPNETAWRTFDPLSYYCLLVDLDEITIGTCCLLNLESDEAITLRVTADYAPYEQYCGGKPTPATFDVAYIFGCIEPDPVPVDYDLYLWFPFLAPVNNPEVTWWCGVALTNYADQPTKGGTFWMWEEDGDEFTMLLPPLGAHEMWLRNLSDFTGIVPSGDDTIWGDEAMSGLVVYTVADNVYPPNYAGDFKDIGAFAGIDAFVLMGDFTQAYGYTARHVDGAQNWNDVPGRAPVWSKKGTK